jgi:CTP synthase (UTP-ammonia lyase)
VGIPGADHEETAPNAPIRIISKLACSLVGTSQVIKINPGSLAHQAYRQQEVMENFACNYGLNPQFQDQFSQGRLRSTGVDLEGETRIVELSEHPFYVATLFLPQIISEPDKPHPLIVAYLKAALDFRSSPRSSGIKN